MEEPHSEDLLHKETKEPGKPKEEIYSNSKIVQVIKTYWELGHEHKFITEIVARRANDCIVSITEPDYKNWINRRYLGHIQCDYECKGTRLCRYNRASYGLYHFFIRSFSDMGKRVHDFPTWNESYQQKYKKISSKDEKNILKLFEEEIEERLKHRRQMRRWEMYVNGRPLGLRRERPE
ncbi:hypothetical protein Tco_1173274 [Tanacetum coccineum]